MRCAKVLPAMTIGICILLGGCSSQKSEESIVRNPALPTASTLSQPGGQGGSAVANSNSPHAIHRRGAAFRRAHAVRTNSSPSSPPDTSK
jgi:hypothetical protein